MTTPLYPQTAKRLSNKLRTFFYSLILLIAGFSTANAAVTVTAASGGTNIPADRAANATSPSYTTLGNIIINENANGDIATGTGVTIIFTAPTGWEFRAGFGSFDADNGNNVTNEGITVTTSTITISYNC